VVRLLFGVVARFVAMNLVVEGGFSLWLSRFSRSIAFNRWVRGEAEDSLAALNRQCEPLK
jgi:hypothetical protein